MALGRNKKNPENNRADTQKPADKKRAARTRATKKSGTSAQKNRVKKVKPAKAAKKKVQKVLSGSRYVLFVGDEGSILLHLRKNVVESRQFVPDATDQNLEELRTSLNKDPKAPVSVVIDSIDQSYIKQSLPPVSSMSVSKLINRRLERDFGADDIKGSILLGRDDSGRKDWNFLMVSVERSRQMSLWLEFAFSLENRFEGIFLASVESEIVLRNIERAMGVPKGGTGSKWKFFISHNKVGGFRQVILHNGHIIFTRMAQPIGEATPEVLAGNIEQEMQSTMEYMKRLSYVPEDGLDITLVGANSLKTVVDKNKFKFNSFTIMTPYEVAQLLGIEGATQPTDQFGDVILAASIASSPKHVLKLTTPESRRFDKLFSVFKLQRVGFVFLTLVLIAYAGWTGYDIYQAYDEADTLIASKHQRESLLNGLKEDIKNSSLDIDKTGDIIELYQLLTKQQVSLPKFIARLQTVIKPPVVVKNVEWSIDSPPAGVVPKTLVVVQLQFASVPDPEAWALISKKILGDLKLVFKGYDVQFTKVAARFAPVDKLDITFDSKAPKAAVKENTQSSDVELTLKEL